MLQRTQGKSILRLGITSHRENFTVVLSVPEEKYRFLYLRKEFNIIRDQKCKVLLWFQHVHFREKIL